MSYGNLLVQLFFVRVLKLQFLAPVCPRRRMTHQACKHTNSLQGSCIVLIVFECATVFVCWQLFGGTVSPSCRLGCVATNQSSLILQPCSSSPNVGQPESISEDTLLDLHVKLGVGAKTGRSVDLTINAECLWGTCAMTPVCWKWMRVPQGAKVSACDQGERQSPVSRRTDTCCPVCFLVCRLGRSAQGWDEP